jgi:hypothetical protein
MEISNSSALEVAILSLNTSSHNTRSLLNMYLFLRRSMALSTFRLPRHNTFKLLRRSMDPSTFKLLCPLNLRLRPFKPFSNPNILHLPRNRSSTVVCLHSPTMMAMVMILTDSKEKTQ